MTDDRLAQLLALSAADPDDALLSYMVASELFRAGRWAEAAEKVKLYLARSKDEGAAYRLLAHASLKLGNTAEAIAALRTGIERAEAHNHTGMAAEFEELLSELTEG